MCLVLKANTTPPLAGSEPHMVPLSSRRRLLSCAVRTDFQGCASSGGQPFEVPGRPAASVWWVTRQHFAAARWRPIWRRRELQSWSSAGVALQMVSLVSPAAEVDSGPVQSLWSAAAASRLASSATSRRPAQRFSRAGFAVALQLGFGKTQRKEGPWRSVPLSTLC